MYILKCCKFHYYYYYYDYYRTALFVGEERERAYNSSSTAVLVESFVSLSEVSASEWEIARDRASDHVHCHHIYSPTPGPTPLSTRPFCPRPENIVIGGTRKKCFLTNTDQRIRNIIATPDRVINVGGKKYCFQ